MPTPGLPYVQLSRAKTIEQLYLADFKIELLQLNIKKGGNVDVALITSSTNFFVSPSLWQGILGLGYKKLIQVQSPDLCDVMSRDLCDVMSRDHCDVM